ncbi:MAG: flagellar export chaperone FlgN [Planctomycetota bacterium]
MAQSQTNPLADLERILRQQIAVYRELDKLLAEHRVALEGMALQPILDVNKKQAVLRDRLAKLEQHRRAIFDKLGAESLTELATKHGPQGLTLLKLRRELQRVTGEVGTQSKLTSKIAAGMLGHLNTAVRVLAEAAGETGLYDKHGNPKLRRRRVAVYAAA